MKEIVNIKGVEITRLGIGTIVFIDKQGVEVRAESNPAMDALFERLKQAVK